MPNQRSPSRAGPSSVWSEPRGFPDPPVSWEKLANLASSNSEIHKLKRKLNLCRAHLSSSFSRALPNAPFRFWINLFPLALTNGHALVGMAAGVNFFAAIRPEDPDLIYFI